MSLSAMLSEHQLDAVLDRIVDNRLCSVMVTKAEPKTPIAYVNDAFTTLTGYMTSEVTGKSPSLLQGEKTDQSVLDRLRSDLSAGRVFEGSTVNYRKDGSEFTMFWRVFPVFNQRCEAVYFVALQQEQPA